MSVEEYSMTEQLQPRRWQKLKFRHISVILLLLAVVFTSILVSAATARADGPTVTINKNIQYQQIDGFGGFGAQLPWFTNGPFYSDSFIQNVVDDLGVTIVRDEVPPTFEQTQGVFDENATPIDSCHGQSVALSQHIPYLKALKAEADAKGEPLKLIASVWSPPAWMKYVSCVFGGDVNWNRLIVNEIPSASVPNDRKADFATYLVRYVQAIKQDTGIDVYAISIQNEPFFAEGYPSAVYSPEVLKNTIKVVGQAFQQNGISTKIFMPEDVTDINRVSGFVEWAEHDPIAKQFVNIIAVHGYAENGITSSSSQEFWSQAYALASKYNTPLWMTETSGYSNDWNGALDLAGAIYTALKYGHLNAWVWWSLSDTSLSAYGLMNNGAPTPLYYAAKQYYRYIRPGAAMVDSQSSDPDVLVTAFNHIQNRTLTAVLINQNSSASKTVSFNFQGGNIPAQFNVYRSSATENAVNVGTINSTDSLTLPPNSVTTIYGTSSGQDAALAPSILTQPQGASVSEGNPVNLSVSAAGTPGLQYQWQRNGSDIAGATGASYVFPAQAADNGAQYAVRISNSAGTIASNAATITVSPFTGAYIVPTTTALTIDGTGNDAVWSTAPSYNLGHVTGSPNNLSTTFQAAADNTNLYYLVKVHDPTFATGSDNVEIYLDGNNSKIKNAYIQNDWQYIFAWGSKTVSQFRGGQSGNDVAGHDISGIQFAQVANSDNSGYQLEVAIPWSTLGGTPAAGSIIGMDLDVAQQSTPGTTNGKVFWNATTDDDWHDPSGFGVAKLGTGSGGPTPTPTPTPTTTPTPTPTATPTSTPTPTPTPTSTPISGGQITSISDLNWVSATNGINQVPNKDKSANGNLLNVSGHIYAKGLGAHAFSTVVYNLNSAYVTFKSDVGVDDECYSGTVDFQVYVDGNQVFDSGVVTGGTIKTVNVSVAGHNELKLVVTDGGDGVSCDHADWAGAQLSS